MSGSLILRPRKTYVYVFEHYLVFAIFKTVPRTDIGIIHSKEITTTAITTTTATTTTNNKVNANSGPRPVMQAVGQARKYKYTLRRQGWYKQTQTPE